MPLRVLYWTEMFFPSMGGTEVLGAAILDGLAARGIEFTVVTSHLPEPLPDEDHYHGIPVHRLHFWEAAAQRDIALMAATRRRVAEIRRSFQPHVIHLNASGPSLFFHVRAQADEAVPWIFTPHAPLTDQRVDEDTILGQAFRSADRIVCVSGAQREQILRLAPDVAGKAVVIYNSVAPEAVPAPPADAPRLLFLGRLAPVKAVDVAIDAAARLAGRFPDLELTIVGEGPERQNLERRAADRGVAEQVRFAGRVPDTRPYFERAAVVVMPSRWEETFGITALEAALMERPIVATRVGALPEVVADGETGILVPRDDPEALAEACGHLLDHPALARRMGRAALERAVERFSLSGMLDAYETAYRELGRTP